MDYGARDPGGRRRPPGVAPQESVRATPRPSRLITYDAAGTLHYDVRGRLALRMTPGELEKELLPNRKRGLGNHSLCPKD